MRLTAAALLLLTLAAPASAGVFTVTKTADTLDGACTPADCSLREAVVAANQAPGTDVIELPSGTYLLTRTGAGEDDGATGDLDVNDPLILVGRDAARTLLDGNQADRVLDVRAETEIFGVTLQGGLVNGPGAGAYARQTALGYRFVVRRSVIAGNWAQGPGGDGGGVKSETSGLLVVLESTVYANVATAKGGGIAATQFWLMNSTVSDNLAALGGGLYYPEASSPPIWGSTIVDNYASQEGGGIYADRGQFPTDVVASLRGSIVARNRSPQHPDCVRAASGGYNVIGVGDSCSDGSLDRAGTLAAPLDPKIGTVDSQGGSTPTHALLPGSPAIDLVPAAACTPSDQMGLARSAPCEAGAVEQPLHPVCVPGGRVLCLQNGRFRVTASWFQLGQSGLAWAAPLTEDTGNFWFFSPRNLELTVKVLDGCALNDRWWVFTSGLTDLGVTLTVEDLYSDAEPWTYTHSKDSGPYGPQFDTSALATCHEPPPPAGTVVPGTLAIDPVSSILLVTQGEDTLDGACDADCSLREAVAASNARPGLEVILLGVGDVGGDRVYTLARAGRGENENATGDLDVKGPLTVLGAGAAHSVIDGGALDRIFDSNSTNAPLEIHGATLRNGDARFDQHTTDYGNGGAVRAKSLTLVASHVTGNRSEGDGGGIDGFLLTARDSTVSNNQTVNGGNGGGIFSTGFLGLANVTVSGNRAAQGFGGGLFFEGHELNGVTVTGNSAEFQGGGIMFGFPPNCPVEAPFCTLDFAIRSSIVAGNQAPDNRDCAGSGIDPLQGGHNVFGIDEEFGCAGVTDLAGTRAKPIDPKLTPLGDHGGPTPTHALLAASPAIDIGDIGPAAGCLPADQRGRTRPSGKGCDAGAVERLPTCQPDETTLCLGEGDRFRVTARWAARGKSGDAHAIPLVTDTGAFWFFSPGNVELTLKVLDGCAVNNRFWVFASGLTNVRVDLTVEDTLTGKTWIDRSPAGTWFKPRLETNALDICPEGK